MFRSAFRSAFRPAIMPAINKLVQSLRNRFVYNFDGIDDRGALQYRAINPDGEIDIEWSQIGISNAGPNPQTIITQSISATITSREFVLRWNGNNGGLQLSVGGAGLALAVPCLDGKYRITYSGVTYTVFYNGVMLRSGSFTRGVEREFNAVTLIGCRNSAGTFTEYVLGRLFDVKISGVLYRIADRDQPIQLPQPSGLGAELITQSVLENPVLKGTQWTYLGGGRWQYVGDGSYNSLRFLSSASHPAAGYIEFEVESITGQMRCTSGFNPAGSANVTFSTVGTKRAYYSIFSLDTQLEFARNSAGAPASCIIKNISFKPLYTADATNIVVNGDFSNGATGWAAYSGGAISVTSGQATLTTAASQNSRFERGVVLETDAYYEISADLISVSGAVFGRMTLCRDLPGNYRVIARAERSAAGKMVAVIKAPANDAIIQIQGDSTNAGTVVVDNVSIRKITGLCNPCALINTNSDRWSEMLE